MIPLPKFTFLTKSEPSPCEMKKFTTVWIIDESKYLSICEVGYLLNTASKEIIKTKFNTIRNYFMIELGLNTGLRVEEMASLKHSNFLLVNGKSSLFVIGKGNKPRLVLISNQFKDTCLKYFEAKREFGFSTDSDSHLLVKASGKNLTKRALQKAFKILVLKSELSNHYYIHCLRHTYSTFLLKASNYNYRFVQRQLGHASIKTTQVYAGVVEIEGRNALEKMYIDDI